MIRDMNFYIVGGLKHSGKSSIGKALARHYGYPFYDLDSLILETVKGTGTTIREVWNTLGKNEFIVREGEVFQYFMDWTLPSLQEKGVVLSLGGGTIENKNAMQCFGTKGFMVYLRADANLLFRRIMAGGIPPFLSEENPWEDFMKLYHRRDSLYCKIAHFIHDIEDVTISMNTQRLIASLENHNGR